MLTDQFLPITPASPLLTGRFVTSRNTCSSWLGNKFGCLFRNSFVRQYLLITFQSTSVKVLFSTIWWGLPNGRLTALRHFCFFFWEVLWLPVCSKLGDTTVEFINMVLSNSLYVYDRPVFCLTPRRLRRYRGKI